MVHRENRVKGGSVPFPFPSYRLGEMTGRMMQVHGMSDPGGRGQPTVRAMTEQWWPVFGPLGLQVLVQHASQDYIHQLHPSANTERRYAEDPGESRDIAFPHVAPDIRQLSVCMG